MLELLKPFVLLFKVHKKLSRKRKKEIYLGIMLMLLSAILESLTLTFSVPFLASLTSNEGFNNNLYLKKIITYFDFLNIYNIQIFIVSIFCLIVIISALIRLLNVWFNCKTTALIGNELGIRGYNNILQQNYAFHVHTKSSKLITGLTGKLDYCLESLYAAFQFILSLFISLSIIITLFYINSFATIFCTLIFLIAYLLISKSVRKKLTSNSKLISKAQDEEVRFIQNGIGNIKEIILGQLQNQYINLYGKIDLNMRQRFSNNRFIGIYPRYTLEAVAICSLSILSIILLSNNSINNVPIAIIGAFALGAQKLLPSLQMLYNTWSSISGRTSEIRDVLNLLELKNNNLFTKETYNLSKTKNFIIFKNVDFKYKNIESNILKNINVKIPLNQNIGIIGNTGSGKSTFIDLIMGFALPSKGNISINDFDLSTQINLRKWQNCISHVPQEIYISDVSIAENIAFGVKKRDINLEKLKSAAKAAEIDNFIEGLTLGYQTILGERGMQLSGGQRQRIGIARAIYRNTKVIILDEATSALDINTEKKILENFKNFGNNKSMIMITHRINTLENFNHIYKIKENNIYKIK